MRNLFFVLLVLWVVRAPRAASEEPLPTASGATAPLTAPLSELKLSHALILGLVEGVTEFIPISSTGHLILITDLLDLDSNQPLFDASGAPLWHRKASTRHRGELLTINLATQAYIVVIQFGAIAAVFPICWSQLMSMFRGALGRDPRGRRLLINLGIAFVPAAFIGLLAHDWIDENLYSVNAVIFALVAGSFLMFFAERWRLRQSQRGFQEVTELTPFGAAGIGILQCLAMWPGTSRPMMTIVGGYFAGLNPGSAAGFSFLLGFVTLSAASIYKTYQSGGLILEVFGWQNVLIGTAVAGVTAAISVRFFVKMLLRSGLAPFAWYRIALAGFLAMFFYR